MTRTPERTRTWTQRVPGTPRPGPARRAVGRALVVIAAAGPIVHAPAVAQFREPGQSAGGPDTSWPAVSVGPRIGYDQGSMGELVGLQVHVPILRSGHVELMPNADVTFLTGLREYQFNAEAVYLTGGRRGGIYAGGGLAFRNSIYGSDPETPRSTERGYSVVAGVRSIGTGPFGVQLEVRWTFLDVAVRNPRSISLGINFQLWGRRSEER